MEVLDEDKYDFVETRDELLKSKSNKIWGSFAPSALAYNLDRKTTKPSEPTLAEMTNKALKTLKKIKMASSYLLKEARLTGLLTETTRSE